MMEEPIILNHTWIISNKNGSPFTFLSLLYLSDGQKFFKFVNRLFQTKKTEKRKVTISI